MTIPTDKIGHLKAGAFTALVYGLAFGGAGAAMTGRIGALIGLAATLLVVIGAAVAKEYLDSLDRENHCVELWDFLATVIGGLLVLVPNAALIMWLPFKQAMPL